MHLTCFARAFSEWDCATSARVQGGNEGNWLKMSSPEASREQRSWYISCENRPETQQIFRSGEMELHRSFHGCALHTTTPLRSCARPKGQVGASFQGLGSGRSTARCAVAWGVVVALSRWWHLWWWWWKWRSLASDLIITIAARLACVHTAPLYNTNAPRELRGSTDRNRISVKRKGR